MSKNRIIDEKYWNQFAKKSSDASTIHRDGQRFENLVFKLLELMYDDISWKQTQMTHDGNKDFKGQRDNKIYWAECKNYKTKINLETLAATLVMAEIENVNAILFFCYSEINKNTKKKLCSFSKSSQKVICFYDGVVLDQLILKYKDKILEEFFPEYLNEISIISNTDQFVPQIFCYLERNPLLNGTVTFDMNDLNDMQELKIGEIIGVHLIVINRNLSKSLKIYYSLEYKQDECPFFPINADIKIFKNAIEFPVIDLAPGEMCHKIIYLKFNKYFPIVEIPKLIVRGDNFKRKSYAFGTISTLSIRRSALLGKEYLFKKDNLKQYCLNKKNFSIALLYGGSGTGKTRMLYECSDIFLGNGYQIVNFKHGSSQISFYSILQELVFALYGFDEMIIDHIVENNYDKLDAYNTTSYKEIFKILKKVYEKRTSLAEINFSEYLPLYEKMTSGKFMIILDDIQYYSVEIINFFQSYVEYAFNRQRRCSTMLLIAVNTDSLYNPHIINFLTMFEKSDITGRDNIYKTEISGFKKESQSQLLLKEVLGIEEDIFDTSELKGISLRPKYIVELSSLLVETHAIEIINGKAFIADKQALKSMLGYLSQSLEAIIDARWQVYIKSSKKTDNYYKILLSYLIFRGEINLEYDKFLEEYFADIHQLFRYGFLKEIYGDKSIYAFEHDTIKNYFLHNYPDWFEVAIQFLIQSKATISEKALQFVCHVYGRETIEQNDIEEYKKIDFSNDILFKVNEYILRLELNQHSSDNTFFDIITNIFKNNREKLGEERTAYLYKLFESNYAGSLIDQNIYQYCRIMLDYSENQLKLKNTEKSIKIYKKIIQCIADKEFKEKASILCIINNRWFVCGRVGGQCQQYNYQWLKSMEIAKSTHYCHMCIENYFDKAQSLFLVAQSRNDALRYLKLGCSAYETNRIKELEGHYLYRKFQISFLEKDYKKLYEKIEDALHILLFNKEIQFKLFFKIQFMIFKVMLCLIKEYDCTDLELKNILDELIFMQTMQNQLQLYRCYYLYGKYYLQRKKWEQAFLFYHKALANLDENINSEEIQQQKKIIFEDMVINLKKYSFPFNKFDFSDFQNYAEWYEFQEVMGMTDKEFHYFYSNYVSPAPVSSADGKDGYLLF